MTAKTCLLILGNQLFDRKLYQSAFESEVGPNIFDTCLSYMSEDFGFCQELKYHKARLHFFIAAMREFSHSLAVGAKNHYYFKLESINPSENYISRFMQFVASHNIRRVCCFEIEDEPFASLIFKSLEGAGIQVVCKTSPMFLCSRSDFAASIKSHSKPFMKTFYEAQRRKSGVLMEHGKPTGGKFSFDEENRLKLPLSIKPPPLPQRTPSQIEITAKRDIELYFSSHPGDLTNLWLPVTADESAAWLDDFFKNRFASFGAYEDALAQHSEFVFHSVLTPMLNSGLLTPDKVINEAIQYAETHAIPLPSLEGFVRQIMGWREFMRGIYQNFGHQQKASNFWNHHKKLAPCWYDGTTGVQPLDFVIKKALKFGYCHHIERLMIVSNMMLLCQVEPMQAYRWFMELFVDSSDWVMTPNVFGMGLFSDGGIFSTKPYICGSNYWVKMGASKDEKWSLAVDGLYWKFIETHRAFFEKNPRLSMMPRMLDKIDPTKKQKIFTESQILLSRLTFD